MPSTKPWVQKENAFIAAAIAPVLQAVGKDPVLKRELAAFCLDRGGDPITTSVRLNALIAGRGAMKAFLVLAIYQFGVARKLIPSGSESRRK